MLNIINSKLYDIINENKEIETKKYNKYKKFSKIYKI